MEQSIVTKLLTNARKGNSTILNVGQLRGRRNSSMLRIGRLKKIGISSGKKVEDNRKGFNIA